MDEVVVKRWCDLCRATEEDARTEAVQRFEVSVAKEGTTRTLMRAVDCCDKHQAQLLGLQEMVKKVGTPQRVKPTERAELADRAEPDDDNMACPVCGRVMTRRAVIVHLVNIHKAKRPGQPAKCPDCRQLGTGGPQGMANHRRIVHGYDYVAATAATIAKNRRKEED